MNKGKDKPHYQGHRARLLQRVLSNSDAVEEYELLEALLTFIQPRKDVKAIAKALLKKSKVDKIQLATQDEVIKGVGDKIKSYHEFLNRVASQYLISCTKREHIIHKASSFASVEQYLIEHDIYTYEEGTYIIYVNKEQEVVGMEQHSCIEEHTIDLPSVIQLRPYGIIVIKKVSNRIYPLCHRDIDYVRTTKQALSLFGIAFIDYIICTSSEMISLEQYIPQS